MGQVFRLLLDRNKYNPNCTVLMYCGCISYKMLIFSLLKSFSAMKKIYALCLIWILFALHGVRSQNALDQNLPTSGGEVVFSKVKELKELELELHMSKVEEWFTQNNFSFELVNENDYSRDKAEGRGSIEVLWGPNNFEQYFKTLKFEIQVVVKKDRYQYRFDHFVVQDGSREAQLEIYQSDTRLGGRYNPAFYREINHKMNVLIENLQSLMTQE